MEANDPEEEAVLRCHLKDLNMTEEAWTGYLDSEERLSEFEHDLLNIGVSFKTYHHEKNVEKARLLFSTPSALIPITSNVPFRVLSIVNKACLFGRDRHQKPDEAAQTRKYRKLQPSKKKGCTAVMQIKCIQLYPDFEAAVDADSTNYKIRKLKEMALRSLTEAMSKNPEEALVSEKRFYIHMTRKCKHTEHDFAIQSVQSSPQQASDSANAQSPKRRLGISKARLQNATNRLKNMAAYCNDQEALDAAYGHIRAALEALSASSLLVSTKGCSGEAKKQTPTQPHLGELMCTSPGQLELCEAYEIMGENVDMLIQAIEVDDI